MYAIEIDKVREAGENLRTIAGRMRRELEEMELICGRQKTSPAPDWLQAMKTTRKMEEDLHRLSLLTEALEKAAEIYERAEEKGEELLLEEAYHKSLRWVTLDEKTRQQMSEGMKRLQLVVESAKQGTIR